MTNTTKAHIIVAINAIVALVTDFGLISVTDHQAASITLAVNAVLSIWVGATYKNSAKRKLT